MVAEHGSKDQLYVENEDRQQCESEEAGPAVIKLDARLFFHPFLSGENSHNDRNAEERLSQSGVSRRDRGRKEEKYCESAEDALGDHCAEGAPAQNPHPAPFIRTPGPDGQDDGQEASDLRDHAVRVLEFDSADELGNLVQRTEGGWPVRDRKSGVVAGDQRSGDDQEKRPAGENNSKTV